MRVRAREAAEIGSVARSIARDEERHLIGGMAICLSVVYGDNSGNCESQSGGSGCVGNHITHQVCPLFSCDTDTVRGKQAASTRRTIPVEDVNSVYVDSSM